mmetsp:Transcript_1362/g.3103  ORF Transcript_1362/g.3103 Transcript_1362/m.3103 type:complete len:170 (-) Transcript_1362:1127-1636(-)
MSLSQPNKPHPQHPFPSQHQTIKPIRKKALAKPSSPPQRATQPPLLRHPTLSAPNSNRNAKESNKPSPPGIHISEARSSSPNRVGVTPTSPPRGISPNTTTTTPTPKTVHPPITTPQPQHPTPQQEGKTKNLPPSSDPENLRPSTPDMEPHSHPRAKWQVPLCSGRNSL